MTATDTIFISKASGESVPFSSEKLIQSLHRAGAGKEEIQRVVTEVLDELYEGISTKEIYTLAFKMLKENSGPLAAKYNLKRAIMELGPSGYPFEKYIAEILQSLGYKTKVGEIVQGKCVSHEIDVIAELGEQHFMIECKYHNQPGTVSNVKIPLYIHARFKDVEAQWLKIPGHGAKLHQGWVVTNTRFSTDAIQYGICAGLHMLGWDYPEKAGLKDMIDTLGLYPITCLTMLTKIEKQFLLDKKIVLCKEICENEYYLVQAGISTARIKSILKEGKELCIHVNGNAKQ